MDKIGVNFDAAVETIKNRLNAEPCILQYPIGKEDNFRGVIDIISMKAYTFDGSTDEKLFSIEIPDSLKPIVKRVRHKTIEQIASTDEKLLDKYLKEEEISIPELKVALRKATIACYLFPVFCGASFKNKGVKFLLDAIVDYLPSPLEVEPQKGEDQNGNPMVCKSEIDAPMIALIFKIAVDPFIGKLTFFRIYSGKIKSGSYVMNTNKGIKERIGRLIRMHANKRQEVEEAFAGDIVAAVGFKKSFTGQTICSLGEKTITLEKINVPEPVISMSLEPATKADQEKLSVSLNRLSEEDPTFRT
nr:elongation factor G-like [Lytechinus pictus]